MFPERLCHCEGPFLGDEATSRPPRRLLRQVISIFLAPVPVALAQAVKFDFLKIVFHFQAGIVFSPVSL
jgi:hypothetical protein